MRVALTTGDMDGIGTEVTAKALAKVKPQRGVQFFLWRSHQTSRRDLNRIDRYFKRVTVNDWPSALRVPADYHKTLIDIDSPLPPAKWVELMAQSAQSKSIDALVTAPLSKTEIVRSGLKDNGHTGILKRISKAKKVYMGFFGKEFNVVLLTGHVSLKKAYDSIDQESLKHCLELSHKAAQWLPSAQKNKPIGLVGLNPHAGEQGIIDKKEMTVYEETLKKLKSRKIYVSIPLVPDVCFQKAHWKKYSLYVAAYHDQGLIPFKMVHGVNSGVQVSIGLPFIRTSVDHGTAKDIFGKNKADAGSMESAIRVAHKIFTKKPIKW
ncbi:MAG: 4-hydroxythreonine-4-phosphate dehydrogenase PdxA [Pseudomonadota bacterium]